MTETKPPNRLSRFYSAITSVKPEKPEYLEIPLAGDAIRVVADQKLKDRLAEWKTATEIMNEPVKGDTLHDYMMDFIHTLEVLNTIVLRVAFVYARAGDKESDDAKHLTHGWNIMYGNFYAHAKRQLIFHGTTDKMTDARDTRQSIHAVIIHETVMGADNILYKYANHVIAWCFKDIDVRPGVVTVVQTIQNPQHTLPFGFGPQQNNPPAGQ